MLNLVVNGLRAGYSTMQAMEAGEQGIATPNLRRIQASGAGKCSWVSQWKSTEKIFYAGFQARTWILL